MYRVISTLLFLLITACAFGQDKDKLFGDAPKIAARSGFILNGNASFDIPGGDMAKRFGLSYRLGPAVLYKTSSNWLFGVKFDFILGNKVKEDSLMINIRDKYSNYNTKEYEFINDQGERIGVPIYERGYAVGITVGKIFAFSDRYPDNGLEVLGTVGFMQHKIDIYDKDKSVQPLRGDLLKGYDRLTNGAFVEGYVGYDFFSNNRLVNFTLGIDAMFGFTQDRRDYLYDVMRSDPGNRLDVLFGLRGGWYIPLFKRKSEDILFE